LPEPDRLIKASRHAGRVALLACGGALSHWERHHLPKVEKIANLTVVTLDQNFISRLVTFLERTITWEITITEGTVYLQVAGETLETSLQVRIGQR